MRKITTHLNMNPTMFVDVHALDGPGPGGASHHYELSTQTADGGRAVIADLGFQNGPVESQDGQRATVGINGITNEALLAVVIDRMQGFQSGEFRCRENAIVITHLETALLWLDKRVAARTERGVIGRLEK